MTNHNRTSHIDWVQGIIPIASEDDMMGKLQWLTAAVADEIVIESDRPRHEGRWYPSSGSSAKGLSLAYDADALECWFSASGSFLANIPDTAKSSFFRNLATLQPRITRLDLALDDYDKVLLPCFLDGAAERGMVPRFARTGYHKSRKCGKAGDTFTAGGRRSPKFYRVYDKEVESGGRIRSIRWELELHGALANGAYYGMKDSSWCDALVIEDMILSNIEFRLPPVNGEPIEARPMAPWWASFVNLSRRILLRASSPVQCVERSMRFLRRQAATALAMLRRTSSDWLGEVRRLAADGEERWGAKHRAILASWIRESDLRLMWARLGWPLAELAPAVVAV